MLFLGDGLELVVILICRYIGLKCERLIVVDILNVFDGVCVICK